MTKTKTGRRPTMRDVAARAEVSVQTVSNIVNERYHLMGGETRARVERAMADLGYHPNVAARTRPSWCACGRSEVGPMQADGCQALCQYRTP